ncbi:pitrilysin family protein [Marinilabiliaceae bacterium ANBcel2]|nr:pitrilysin family protein [Marinilabiliaceae bacterium ANBcel2]
MKFYTNTLQNGIRVIHHPSPSPVAHCGIIINVGSRDEKEDEHGIAHFIEHILFKGTKKRKTYHILSRIDDVGGELNAYTTKEETSIFATFLKEDFNRAIELLHDITFNSIFPQKEIVKEKEVIIDEINSYKDNPSELIIDDFEEFLYPNDPIGRNILGTPETIKRFNQSDITEFIKNNYHTDQIVICTVGEATPKKIFKTFDKYFADIPYNPRKTVRKAPSIYIPKRKNVTLDTFQSHITLGNRAFDINHPEKTTMLLLNNLLGGPGMNSRLNMALREKSGIAYNIESIYAPYSGTGVFTIYFGTDKENIERSIKIVTRELKKIREKKLGKIQLHNAQRQLKGQIAIANENKENLMLSIGKSYMLYNRVDTLEDICKKIDRITAADILEVANKVLNPDDLSYLIYQ